MVPEAQSTGQPALEPNAALGGEASKMVAAAARGSSVAQRMLRDACVEQSRSFEASGRILEAHLCALSALFWARLTASHGAEGDTFSLAGALANAAQFWGNDPENKFRCDAMLGEVFAILEGLASNGNEQAAQDVNTWAELVPPEVLSMAKQITEAVDAE